MVWNMYFWEGKTKAREVRAQEESVDALSPGSLFAGVERANWSMMTSMSSVGMVGKDMVRSSSHTFTNSNISNYNYNINDDTMMTKRRQPGYDPERG